MNNKISLNLRKYGKKPFTVAVIHGGPGAAGTMAPLARDLSAERGVLEPLQTVDSVEGQVQELKIILEKNATLPVNLIGSSWGAMLGFIFTARFPKLTKKLILVGSGGFEEKYAVDIMHTRLNRLNEKQRQEVLSHLEVLNDPAAVEKDTHLAYLGELFTKADTYNPITLNTEVLDVNFTIYKSVWKEAQELRNSHKLLKLGKHIRCPVTAIHGDYDPHPAEGVKKPLSQTLKNFRFILLKNCGHLPWIEKEVKKEFYDILREELD